MNYQKQLDVYNYQQSEKGAKVQSVIDEMANKYSTIIGKKVKSGRIECLKSETTEIKIFYER